MNDAFYISSESASDSANGNVELALRQALTPATQVAFLDLKKRYRAQFALRDDVIFMELESRWSATRKGWKKLDGHAFIRPRIAAEIFGSNPHSTAE